MDKILDYYNKLVIEFIDNEEYIHESFIYMITAMLLFNEERLVIDHSLYDYIFQDILKHLNNGVYGPFEDMSRVYSNALVHSTSNVILKMLKKNMNTTDLSNSLNGLVNRLRKLNDIDRVGWVIRNVDENFFESDGMHTMQMFALASFLFNTNALSDTYDIRKVYEMILIHEFGEIEVGDIPLISSKHKQKDDLERQVIHELFKPYSSGNHFVSLWEEFTARETKEAKLVYEIDKIDPVLKAKILDYLTNRTDLFKDFYSYEEKKGTFENSEIKSLYLLSKDM